MMRKLVFGIIAVIMMLIIGLATPSEAATLQKDDASAVQEIVPPIKEVFVVNRRGQNLSKIEAIYRSDYLGIISGCQTGELILVHDDESVFELAAQADEYNRLSSNRKVALTQKDFSAFTSNEKERYEELKDWVVFDVQFSENENQQQSQKVHHDALNDMYSLSTIMTQIKTITMY